MNQVTQQMKNRRSIRKFNDDPIDDKILKDILLSARQTPNSINGQQSSIIVIKDKNILKELDQFSSGYAKVSDAQMMLLIVIDFYKTYKALKLKNQDQIIQNSLEGLMIGSVDVGIIAESISVAADSFNIGSTIIGGIRNNPQKVIELCDLPKYSFPVVGVILGYPENNNYQPKERLPYDTFVHYEKYNDTNLTNNIIKYNQKIDAINKNRGLENLNNYSEQLAKVYSKESDRIEKINQSLKKQRFKIL